MIQPIVLPVETNGALQVRGYRDGRGIRVCLQEGGYVTIGMFRAAYFKADTGQELVSGPVTIKVEEDESATVMIVTVTQPGGGETTRVLDAEACEEIAERLSQADALLYSYEEKRGDDLLPLERAVLDTCDKE